MGAHLGELAAAGRSEGRDRAPTCLGRIPERRGGAGCAVRPPQPRGGGAD
eukprot:COSAG02_NODE_342_length_24167_cov_5.061118_1_plen_49_part_10